ncbi:MAG: hypothetical protein AABY87_08655 [bacterium]
MAGTEEIPRGDIQTVTQRTETTVREIAHLSPRNFAFSAAADPRSTPWLYGLCKRFYFPFYTITQFLFCNIQVIIILQTEPELRK